MAIIYSYPGIDEISTGDLILVSDSSKNNATKSASVDQLKAYTNTGQATITQVNDRVVTGSSFNTSSGVLTLTRSGVEIPSVTTNLDGRYLTSVSSSTNDNLLGIAVSSTSGAVTIGLDISSLTTGTLPTIDEIYIPYYDESNDVNRTVAYSDLIGASPGVQSLTTAGTSGAATLTNGVLNIPQYSGGGSYLTFTRTFTGNELVNAFNGNVSDSITLISVPSGKIGFVERAMFIIKGASTGTTNYNANGSLYVFPTGATTSSNQVNVLSSALNAGSDYFFTSTNAGSGNSVAAFAPVGADIVLGSPSGGSGVTISQGDRDVVLYVIYKIIDF